MTSKCGYGCQTYNPLCDACDSNNDDPNPYTSRRDSSSKKVDTRTGYDRHMPSSNQTDDRGWGSV